MQRHLDLGGLVLRQNGPLLHVQPVVRADRDAHKEQAAGTKHAAQQGQGTAAAVTHPERRGAPCGACGTRNYNRECPESTAPCSHVGH